jgi:UDP-N-acetylglucosamine 2-epimerase (non-hydrolysing)
LIACVYGTTGELIKLAPVLLRLEKRGADLTTWCTGQQADELAEMATALGLPEPDLLLGKGFRGQPLAKAKHIPTWIAQVTANFAYSWPRLRRAAAPRDRSIVLVHGDTFTTVLGALFARSLGIQVGHIEAGMRSHDIRHPFPEELNRRTAAWLTSIHFAPGSDPVSNLRRRPGTVVDTGMNTVRDSLDLVPDATDSLVERLGPLPEVFGVVSLHRFEFIRDRHLFEATLRALQDAAKTYPLYFVDHAPTRVKVEEYGLESLFADDGLRRVAKLSYFEFITLVRRSSFAVTDSGGLQQESYYLGHPCLVHRSTTETLEGLDGNVVLSRFDLGVLREFLRDPTSYALAGAPEGPSPSDIVVDVLRDRGFCP